MRLPFSPIVTGTFLAILFLVFAYFMMGENQTRDDWEKDKTQNDSKITGDSKKDPRANKTSTEGKNRGAETNHLGEKSDNESGERQNRPGTTFSLDVSFDGGPFKDGQIVAGLFDNSANFRNRKSPIQSCFLKVAGKDEYKWEFKNVPAGSYAISAYLDVNENSTLDKGAFGVPKEKYGFSNNARGRLGPPSYQACTFELDKSKTLTILLK